MNPLLFMFICSIAQSAGAAAGLAVSGVQTYNTGKAFVNQQKQQKQLEQNNNQQQNNNPRHGN